MNCLQLFDLPTSLIPQQLKDIAAQCGQRTAEALLLHYAGVHVFVPKTAQPGHRLAELLGMDSFGQLSACYGGEVINVPRAAAAYRAWRNQLILQDFANGRVQSAIAQQLGMTERQVNRICNEVAVDRQLDLFG